ncbi:MAG: hypothetical protein IT261_14775 [Saprospiraceae bacterium]|nr:hypothetical protein [Saprospiraceae bacterium]
MTKHLFIILSILSLSACKEEPVLPGDPNNPPAYSKADLKKLKWIEGNWKSDVGGQGFYQQYAFPTDSTLEILSYQFDGKDTSANTITTLYWSNQHLYMGPNKEWVGVLLTDNALQLSPTRAGWHTINWTYDKEKGTWTAVHKRPDFIRTLKMIRQAPLGELQQK